MKLMKGLAIVFMILFPAVCVADGEGLMRISLIQGDVQVSGPDITDWTAATINLPLNEGDRLWMPEEARVETQIRGGVGIRADEKTAFDVLSLGGDSAQLYLDRGNLYVNNRRGGIKIVQVDTPAASVRSYDNSIITVDVDEGGRTEVTALKGYVYAETRAGATRISAGNTLTIREDATAELAPIGQPDEWERWNLDRDKQLVAWGESARYLPDELHEYSSDFDENGAWTYVSDYGYVWSPAVTTVEWAPYTVGRWIWSRNNYVWVSFESWGWVPYHYGRWAFVTGTGWCWVPPSPGAIYWGPGFVGWVVTPTYAAWIPLAPGEIFYGYGYYGPGSVNITTVNINTFVVKQKYKNRTFKNAVTVVDRNTFGTGTRVTVNVRENPFLRPPQKIEIVPPRVKPERPVVLRQQDTGEPGRMQPPPRMRQEPEKRKAEQRITVTPPAMRPEKPVITQIPGRTEERKQPPEHLQRIRPEELKMQRKLVKERDASAFKQEKPANLPVKQFKEPRVIIRKPATLPAGQHQQKNRGEKKEDR